MLKALTDITILMVVTSSSSQLAPVSDRVFSYLFFSSGLVILAAKHLYVLMMNIQANQFPSTPVISNKSKLAVEIC